MGIVVSAVASGLVQNIQKDFIKEEEEKKFVRWKEEQQLVEVQDEEEEEDDRRVEIPGFPPVTLDIPSLHREGGKQGRVSRSSQQSQTDSPRLESILRTRELSNGEQGQSQPVDDQQLTKSTRENSTSTSTSLLQDFFSSLGRRSPKSSEKDKEEVEEVDRKNGDIANKDEISDSNANSSETNSELTKKDNEINGALLEGHNAQPKAINESPAKTRRPTFDETPLPSPSRRSRLGSDDGVHFGIMPIVNLLPKYPFFLMVILWIMFHDSFAGLQMRYLQNSYVPGQPGSEVATPTSKLCRRFTSLTPSTLLAGGEKHPRPSLSFPGR